MRSVDKFFFREDAQGLSILNAGVPAYSARISPEQLRSRPVATHVLRPLEITWFGPRPANERELIEELWVAVDEFCRQKAGASDEVAHCSDRGDTSYEDAHVHGRKVRPAFAAALLALGAMELASELTDPTPQRQ